MSTPSPHLARQRRARSAERDGHTVLLGDRQHTPDFGLVVHLRGSGVGVEGRVKVPGLVFCMADVLHVWLVVWLVNGFRFVAGSRPRCVPSLLRVSGSKVELRSRDCQSCLKGRGFQLEALAGSRPHCAPWGQRFQGSGL